MMKSNTIFARLFFGHGWKCCLAALAVLGIPHSLHGQTVTSDADLQAALNTSATPATTDTTIVFANNISLLGYSAPTYDAGSGFLGAINAPISGGTLAVLTIDGSGKTLTGGNANALFFASPENETATGGVSSPTPQSVIIQNLTITGATSHGGNSGFGGGGAGLGGGLFIGTGVNLALNNVTFSGNQAIGGSSTFNTIRYAGGGIGGNAGEYGGGGLYATPTSLYSGGGATGGQGFGGGPGGFGGGGAYFDSAGGFGAGGSYGGGAAGFGAGGSYNGTDGGFGGGGGYFFHSGGVGGGTNNGGGAGFGGAIFIQNGATLTLIGTDTLAGDTATGGTGTSNTGAHHNGAGVGNELFMMTGSSVTLAPGAGMTITIGASGDTGDNIADDSVSSLPTGQTYTAGIAAGAGLVLGSSASPNGTVILYGTNTYAGGTLLQDGTTVVVGSSQALGIGALTTVGNTVVYANGVSVANSIVMTGDTALEVDDLGSATQAGVISESGASHSFTKTGTGTLSLTNANTYSGGTTINSGVLEAQNNSALGTGDVTVGSGTSLQLSGAIQVNNNITISGTGAGGAGAIFSTDAQSNYIGGTVTLADDASVHNENGNSLLIFNGDVSLGSHTITVAGASQTVFNGQISGTGGFTVGADSAAAMGGGSDNIYSGVTTVSAGAFLGLVKGDGIIAIPGDLNITGGIDDYYSSQIATTAVVTFSGNGNLAFVSNNVSETVAGIQGGTLTNQVGTAGTTGDSLTVEGTGTYTYAGRIDDNGGSMALVKQGAGSQELDGPSTYSGGTMLSAGTLIAGSGTALGTGSVQFSAGTLKMGNNNHALTIGGYTQTGGSLVLNVSGVGQNATADHLNVTNGSAGQVTLGGNLTVNLGGFSASAGSHGGTYTFTLVSTAASYTGTFTTFDPLNAGAGLTTNLDYTADDVLLQITLPAGTFSLDKLTANQRGIASSLNTGITAGSASPSFAALVTALAPFSNSPASLGTALDQLSPAKFGRFTTLTAVNNASFGTEALDNYLAGLRVGPNGTFVGGNGSIDVSGLTMNDPNYDPTLAMVHSRLMAWNPGPARVLSDLPNPMIAGVEMKDPKDMKSMTAPAYSDPWNFFVRGNVILAQGFSEPGISHFDDNTESVQLGTDYRFSPNFLVGLTASYGHTDATLDNDGSSATVDSYSPGIYASYADKGWYANASGNYTHNAYTQDRVIGFLGQTASSAPEGNEGVANLDGGYDFHHGALTFGPLAGVQYTHLTVDGYHESGSIADLNVNDENTDSLRSRLGGRVSYAFCHGGMSLTPHLDASWQHEFLDQARGITSQFEGAAGSFDVKTSNPSRDSALIDAGIDAQINRTITVFGDYEFQAGQDNYFGQSVQAGVKVNF
jgi:autotransporter-associated beta strand protein